MARTDLRLWLGCLLGSLTLTLVCTQCSLFERGENHVADIGDVDEAVHAAEKELKMISLGMLQVPFTQEQRESIALETITPKRHALQEQRTVYGKILPNEQHYAHVVTQLSGGVKEVLKQKGDPVKAGEPLAWLNSPQLADGVTVYLAALHQRDVAERNLEREERLYQQQLVAEGALIDAANKATQQRMEVVFAEQKLCGLGLTELQVAQLPNAAPSTWRQVALVAPFDGVVLDRDLVVGEWVSAEHPAFTIVDLNTVWAELELPVSMLESVKIDKTLALYDMLSRDYAKGKVIYISPRLNQENFTVHVVAEVDNHSKKWRLGSSIEAELLFGEKEAVLTLPRTAIQRIDGQEVVFVEAPGGFSVRPVEVGNCDTKCVEILGGLCDDDHCVADNTFILKSQLVLRESEEEEKREKDDENDAKDQKEGTQ